MLRAMRDVTIRQLQIFAAVARHLSFSRASAELHLTQPAVSMQVKQLEHLAGLPLLERSGRKVKVTQAGEEMLRHAQVVMRTLQEATDAFAALRGLRGGRVAIAAVSTAKYFAPKLLALFSGRHPEVELRLAVNNRDAVRQYLQADEVDLAIMGTPPPGLDAIAVPFARHPLVVVAHPGHPLAGRRRVSVAALAREPFLVRERGSGTRAVMEGYFQKHGLEARAAAEISSNETIKQAAMAGMGLAFLSQHTIGLELAAGHLALVHAEGLPVMRDWNVVHRKEKRLSPAAQAMKAFVLEEGSAFLKGWPQG